MNETGDDAAWPSRLEHAEARDILIEYVNGCGSHQLASLYSFAAKGSAEILIDGKSVCRYVNGTIWWELETHDAVAKARLTEAAPDLLKACKRLLFDGSEKETYPCYCSDKDHMAITKNDRCDNCIAAAAIAKAEGGQE